MLKILIFSVFYFIFFSLFSQKQYSLAPIRERGFEAKGIIILMDTSMNIQLRKTNTQLGALIVENLKLINVPAKMVYYGEKYDTLNNLVIRFNRENTYNIFIRRYGVFAIWDDCHTFEIQQQNKRPKDHDIIYSILRLRVKKIDIAVEQAAEKIAEKLKKTLIVEGQ